MASVTFKCTLITPLFMSGADQNEWEIRAQSIKGMMAFWWRAMNPHVPLLDSEEKNSKGEPLQKGLRSLEGKLFGDTSQRSPVKIRITDNPSNRNVPHFNIDDSYKLDSGVKYLFFSMFQRNKKLKNLYRVGIAPSKESFFSIKLSSHDKAMLKKWTACFWLSAFLGGIGSRSRRGCGNFIVKIAEDDGKIATQTKLQFEPILWNVNDVMAFYKSGFEICKEILIEEILENYMVTEEECYSYSSLKGAKLLCSRNFFKDSVSALNQIGEKYREYRLNEEAGLTSSINNVIKKAPFGLPIIKGGWTIELKGKDGENFNRRSSPLIIRVFRGGKGKYFWIMLRLRGLIAPEETKVVALRKEKPSKEREVPGFRIVDDFIEKLLGGKVFDSDEQAFDDDLLDDDTIAKMITLNL